MGKTKVVLDTNIIVSAFGWSGRPREIFELILNGKIELVSSPKLLSELKRVLNYSKFKFSDELKKEVTNLILNISMIVVAKTKINVIKEDPSDNCFLEAAVSGRADFIITGDKHLLNLREYKRIKILTATEFLKLFKP